MQKNQKPDEAQIFKIQLPRTQQSRHVAYNGPLVLPFLTGYLVPKRMYPKFNAMLRIYMFLPLTEQLYDLLNKFFKNTDTSVRYSLECQARKDNVKSIFYPKEKRKDTLKQLGVLKTEEWRLYLPLILHREFKQGIEKVKGKLSLGLPPHKDINKALQSSNNPFNFGLGTFEKEIDSACYTCPRMLDNLAGECTPGTGTCHFVSRQDHVLVSKKLTTEEITTKKELTKIKEEADIWEQILKSLNLLSRK